MRGIVALLLLLVVALSSAQLVVQTDKGPVRGVQSEEARQFLGIPYAEPPLGKLRWADPEEKAAWSPNVLDATQYGPGLLMKHSLFF